MEEDNMQQNDRFYKDISRITLEGLSQITSDLNDFYKELSVKFQPALTTMANDELPEASDQLNAIVEATETATFKIMDELEAIQEGQQKVRGILSKIECSDASAAPDADMVKDASSAIDNCQNRVMTIFEELSFQDLTGQRIKRIVSLVKSIETKVDGILGALGSKLPDQQQEETVSAPAAEPALEEPALKGPQREGEAMDQSAIDALLSGL